MNEMLCDINQSTQPIRPYRVFNNWDAVAKGWYIACRSKDIKRGKAFSKKLCGHKIALFRTQSGQVKALDAFCPHMGMDLGAGKVTGENIKCHFHHWKFDGKGKCVDIPCLPKVPADKFTVKSYPVEEKYGFVWVYSDFTAKDKVFEVEELKGKKTIYTSLKPFKRIAHPHITMMNSIDTQHMRTVHRLDIDMEADIEETGSRFYARFEGGVRSESLIGRLQKYFFGDTYRSSVLFVDGCIGLLTTMIDVKFLNRWAVPRGHFIFSQTTVEKGRTEVYPVIVTELRSGFFGFIYSHLLLQFNRAAIKFLAWQDGYTIYHALRFQQGGLLPGIDGPSAKWISFVNSKIELSPWSRGSQAQTATASFDEPPSTIDILDQGPAH
jgi:phenylpropionate dioxygenase-like ring-hydroxylating dioxygenase large terminal subunit